MVAVGDVLTHTQPLPVVAVGDVLTPIQPLPAVAVGDADHESCKGKYK